MFIDQDGFENALKYSGKSLIIGKETFGKTHPFVAEVYNNMGEIHLEQGNLDTAHECFQNSLSILQNAGDPENEAHVLKNMEKLYRTKGDWSKALKYYETAQAIHQDN